MRIHLRIIFFFRECFLKNDFPKLSATFEMRCVIFEMELQLFDKRTNDSNINELIEAIQIHVKSAGNAQQNFQRLPHSLHITNVVIGSSALRVWS